MSSSSSGSGQRSASLTRVVNPRDKMSACSDNINKDSMIGSWQR